MRGEQLAGLNLNTGDAARIRQNGHEIVLPVDRDDRLAPGTVRIAAAHPLTAGLGARFGIISVEKA
jgi:NADH-quinone oxidoreductase subunit G